MEHFNDEHSNRQNLPSHLFRGLLPASPENTQAQRLLQAVPKDAHLKQALIGIGYDSRDIPLDLAAILLAGKSFGQLTILIADEFQGLNGMLREEIQQGCQRNIRALEALSQLYGQRPQILPASTFMESTRYREVLRFVSERVEALGLSDELLATVPEQHRHRGAARVYPLHELACVEYLRRFHGQQVKFGPGKEHAYDQVMQKIGLPLEFAYLNDALPLGTRKPRPVVHYISSHTEGGIRLLLSDSEDVLREKLGRGFEKSLRYYLQLAAVAAEIRGHSAPNEDEINSLSRSALIRLASELLIEHILRPVQNALREESHVEH